MSTAPALEAARWRKSSYSNEAGGECVEVAALGGATWHKSSYSSSTGGECLEVADLDGIVAVRDSKNPDGPALTVSPAAFAAFVTAAKGGL